MLEDNTEFWRRLALCKEVDDPTIFFPPPKRLFTRLERERIEDAKAVCSHCPVRTNCLEQAERNDEVGIWGGRHFYGSERHPKVRLTTLEVISRPYPPTPV